MPNPQELLTKTASTCEYSVDTYDWIRWGGDPTLWCLMLHELDVDGNVWRCPHVAVSEDRAGTPKCVFHLDPDEVPAGMNASRTLSEILAANDCDVDAGVPRLKQFVGATFGALAIDDTPYEITDDRPLYLIGATVTEELAITGSIPHRIVAPLAKFEGRTDLANATFKEEVDFQKSTFEQEADFREAIFEQEADFREVTFDQEANFAGSTFERKVNFQRAGFQETVDFTNVFFGRGLVFEDATFDSKPKFHEATFMDGCGCGRDKVTGPCLK